MPKKTKIPPAPKPAPHFKHPRMEGATKNDAFYWNARRIRLFDQGAQESGGGFSSGFSTGFNRVD